MERPNTENCRGAFEVENFYEQPSLASEKVKRIEIIVPQQFRNLASNDETFFFPISVLGISVTILRGTKFRI